MRGHLNRKWDTFTRVDFPRDRAPLITAWLEERGAPYYITSTRGRDGAGRPSRVWSRDILTYMIKDHRIAVFAKLVWGGK